MPLRRVPILPPTLIALMAMVSAVLLPGVHAWQIGHPAPGDAQAWATERVAGQSNQDAPKRSCSCRHHVCEDDESTGGSLPVDAPRPHDHDDCHICLLIDLLASSSHRETPPAMPAFGITGPPSMTSVTDWRTPAMNRLAPRFARGPPAC